MANDLVLISRTKRSASEWRALVKAYGKRACTRAEFCRQQGVAESTLDWWRRKLETRSVKRASSSVVGTPSLDFIDLTLSRVESPAWDVELDLGAGMVLRLRRSAC